MQDEVITRSLAMFDCELWSPASISPARSPVEVTPMSPTSATTQSLTSSSPTPPRYTLLPSLPTPTITDDPLIAMTLPSQTNHRLEPTHPPPDYMTVQQQESFHFQGAHWWDQTDEPLFCWIQSIIQSNIIEYNQ